MRYGAAKKPMVLYPPMPDLRVGEYDCDCACDLGLPKVARASSASVVLDCDCACTSDGSVVLTRQGPEDPAPTWDCDCACASDGSVALTGQWLEDAAPTWDCDCACASGGRPQGVAPTWDCDCACAAGVAQGQAGPAGAGRWIREERVVSMPVGDGWQACFNPAGPVGVSALNAEAGRVLAAFDPPVTFRGAVDRLAGMPMDTALETTRELVQIGLLRPFQGGGRHSLRSHATQGIPPLRATATSSSMLSAWLHVTEACNLRCPYCYVHKQPRVMTWEVGRQTVDRLVETADRHGYGALKLKYAGGEPTLNFSLIEALHVYAVERTAGAKVRLEEVLLTNGVGVTDAMLDFISRAGMRLMVSLDGGPGTHDLLRARPDGGSTYAAVTGTLERAVERGLRPNISITVTSLNLDGAGEAVALALERGLPFNVNFYRECAPGGEQKARGPLSPSPAQLLEAMQRIVTLIQAHPTYPLPLTAVLDRTRLDIPHSHTCSAGRDYLVVGTAGQVSACQMMMEEPWTTLADADPLCAVRRRGEELFKAADDDPECTACTWRTACSGGCPLLRKSVLHGDYCQVYRALFPELVQLEAKRLIAQAGG
jgi:uncharacterized protein